jgi:hypothetical protein
MPPGDMPLKKMKKTEFFLKSKEISEYRSVGNERRPTILIPVSRYSGIWPVFCLTYDRSK